jgi:hypothetical protein
MAILGFLGFLAVRTTRLDDESSVTYQLVPTVVVRSDDCDSPCFFFHSKSSKAVINYVNAQRFLRPANHYWPRYVLYQERCSNIGLLIKAKLFTV